MELYKKLPDDIINIILLYVGNFRYRNGKFISQIAKCDKRYEILKTITKPKCSFQKNGIISYTIFFSNNNILSSISENFIFWARASLAIFPPTKTLSYFSSKNFITGNFVSGSIPSTRSFRTSVFLISFVLLSTLSLNGP